MTLQFSFVQLTTQIKGAVLQRNQFHVFALKCDSTVFNQEWRTNSWLCEELIH